MIYAPREDREVTCFAVKLESNGEFNAVDMILHTRMTYLTILCIGVFGFGYKFEMMGGCQQRMIRYKGVKIYIDGR